uniref:wiskott-Aldrich syndrome protein family member 2 n=1 Tax=Fragaria vesca subsp. vesca TaxID=101020 RepID=UPI0005C8001E|nr:PREDICTED: wiskott-Aldrich syndrome protein family member 2 [Fragaria vesca subsp. vesca]
MDNEEEETQKEIKQKRKNSDQFGESSSTRVRSAEEEEEDMLELRLNSQRSSRPRPSAPPQPHTRNLVPPELHQLSITHSPPNLQPRALNPPSNHVHVSNTHPVYRGELLLPAPEPLFYPLNSFHGPNHPSLNARPPPPPPPPQSQPSVMFHLDMRPRDVQGPQPQPQAVFHQDVRARSVQNPPPAPPAGGLRPLVLRPARAPRRNPTQAPGQGRSEKVPAPFPWATTKRATVYSLSYLEDHNILTISGEVQCKRCETRYEIEYNLKDKFMEVATYIAHNRSMMHDRAPDVWKDPVLPTCKNCDQENCAKPVVADKKKEINWLFLFLGQMLGCCTLEQLKYFCKHTKNHRTGAKDRVLYLTYLSLAKQLDPTGPFDP